ncbi:MAG: DinB family protein [Holophagaceae bacterium]|nr:DinB family protein [Holophagaceae bacterium]
MPTRSWSTARILETYGATRIRLLLAEKEPLIVGYDENKWAEAFDYPGHDVELAFRTIEAVRSNTVTMLRRLPEEAWNRAGQHSHSGSYSDADWLRIYAEHLEVHARQIRRNIPGVQAWNASCPLGSS